MAPDSRRLPGSRATDLNGFTRFCIILERIVMWSDPATIVGPLIAFNLKFFQLDCLPYSVRNSFRSVPTVVQARKKIENRTQQNSQLQIQLVGLNLNKVLNVWGKPYIETVNSNWSKHQFRSIHTNWVWHHFWTLLDSKQKNTTLITRTFWKHNNDLCIKTKL